jgi:hypothetical protein
VCGEEPQEGIRYLGGLFLRREVTELREGHDLGMGDRLGQLGEGDGLPAGGVPVAVHDQGGRIDLAVVCEPAVEAPDFGVLADRLRHERQVLPEFGARDRPPQDHPKKPAGHASRLIRIDPADEGDECLEVRTRRDLPACTADPVHWDRAANRDPWLVDGDRIERLAAARRSQGHEPAEAVPEDQPGAGFRAYRLDVLAFPRDAVLVALRAAAAPAAPLHDVHGMPHCQEFGQGGQVGGQGERSGDHDHVRPAPQAEVLDGGAVRGGQYPDVHIRHGVLVSLVEHTMYAPISV